MAGENETGRPASSLFWSGVSAGFAISLSVLCKGIFEAVLPKAGMDASSLESRLCGGLRGRDPRRMQLFTENTITPILPLFFSPTAESSRAPAGSGRSSSART